MGRVRRTRLARARQQLLAADGAANVTGIAVANGFTELGGFAAQYRQQFGELPSQTLRTARHRPLKQTDEIDDEAQLLSWRAVSSAFMVGPESCSVALAGAERAQELAPDYALPKAIAAWCWSQRAAHHFADTPALDRAHALQLGNAARAAGRVRPQPLQRRADVDPSSRRCRPAD